MGGSECHHAVMGNEGAGADRRPTIVFVLVVGALAIAVWAVAANGSTTRPAQDLIDVTAGQPDLDDEGLEGHLAWALDLIDGAAPSLDEVEARLAPAFLETMSPEMFLAQTEVVTDAAPYRFHGLDKDEDASVIAALLVGTDDTPYALTLSSDPTQPDLIDGLLIVPAEVERGPFSAVELTLHVLAVGIMALAVIVLWLLDAPGTSFMLAVVGVAFSSALFEIADGALFTVGLLSGPFAVALLAAVVASVKPGTSHEPRVLAGVGVVAASAVAWLPLVAIDTSAISLPDQPLAVVAGPDTARSLVAVSGWGVIVLAAGLTGHLLVRQFRADWSRNRGLVATTLGGSAAAAMVAVAAVFPALDPTRHDLSMPPLVSVAMVVAVIGLVGSAAWDRYDLGHVAAELEAENEELHAEVRAQLAEVRASRARIVQAGDEARRAVERDLHDGAQQRLLAAQLAIRMGRTRFAADDPDLDGYLAGLAADVGDALSELREISRGLHPAILDEGLVAAAGALAETSAIPMTVTAGPSVGRCSAEVEHASYYVLSEALTNATRHADAGHVAVDIDIRESDLVIRVRDDGVGGAAIGQGNGLVNIEDRVMALGGRLSLVSPTGGGTEIEVVFPCG